MANILKITIDPDPILRKISRAIRPDDLKNYNQLFPDMARTMLEKDGIGLAAPQIGKNIRLIVINTKEGPLHMINPEIAKRSWRKEWGDEGCLSVPNTFGKVSRHKKVACAYLDKNGQKNTLEAAGLMARVIQHEIDHLDGVLFTDKAKNVKKA